MGTLCDAAALWPEIDAVLRLPLRLPSGYAPFHDTAADLWRSLHFVFAEERQQRLDGGVCAVLVDVLKEMQQAAEAIADSAGGADGALPDPADLLELQRKVQWCIANVSTERSSFPGPSPLDHSPVLQGAQVWLTEAYCRLANASPPCPAAALCGGPGTGKSRLALALGAKLTGRCLWYDAAMSAEEPFRGTPQGVIRSVLLACGWDPEAVFSTASAQTAAFHDALHRHHLTLVVDNVSFPLPDRWLTVIPTLGEQACGSYVLFVGEDCAETGAADLDSKFPGLRLPLPRHDPHSAFSILSQNLLELLVSPSRHRDALQLAHRLAQRCQHSPLLLQTASRAAHWASSRAPTGRRPLGVVLRQLFFPDEPPVDTAEPRGPGRPRSEGPAEEHSDASHYCSLSDPTDAPDRSSARSDHSGQSKQSAHSPTRSSSPSPSLPEVPEPPASPLDVFRAVLTVVPPAALALLRAVAALPVAPTPTTAAVAAGLSPTEGFRGVLDLHTLALIDLRSGSSVGLDDQAPVGDWHIRIALPNSLRGFLCSKDVAVPLPADRLAALARHYAQLLGAMQEERRYGRQPSAGCLAFFEDLPNVFFVMCHSGLRFPGRLTLLAQVLTLCVPLVVEVDYRMSIVDVVDTALQRLQAERRPPDHSNGGALPTPRPQPPSTEVGTETEDRVRESRVVASSVGSSVSDTDVADLEISDSDGASVEDSVDLDAPSDAGSLAEESASSAGAGPDRPQGRHGALQLAIAAALEDRSDADDDDDDDGAPATHPLSLDALLAADAEPGLSPAEAALHHYDVLLATAELFCRAGQQLRRLAAGPHALPQPTPHDTAPPANDWPPATLPVADLESGKRPALARLAHLLLAEARASVAAAARARRRWKGAASTTPPAFDKPREDRLARDCHLWDVAALLGLGRLPRAAEGLPRLLTWLTTSGWRHPLERAGFLCDVGALHLDAEEPAAALPLLGRALALTRAGRPAPPTALPAAALGLRARGHLRLGRYAAALRDHEEAWPLLAPGHAAPPQSEAEAAALLAAAAPGPALWDALLGLAELYAATHRYAPATAVLRALRAHLPALEGRQRSATRLLARTVLAAHTSTAALAPARLLLVAAAATLSLPGDEPTLLGLLTDLVRVLSAGSVAEVQTANRLGQQLLVALVGAPGPPLAPDCPIEVYEAEWWRWWRARPDRGTAGPFAQRLYHDALLALAECRYLLGDSRSAVALAETLLLALHRYYPQLQVTLTLADREERPEKAEGAVRHPTFLDAQVLLVECFLKLQDTRQALNVGHEALALSKLMYGDVHPRTAACHDALGHVQRQKRTSQFAQLHYQKALDRRQEALPLLPAVTRSGNPLDHPDIATSLLNLSLALMDLDKLEESRDLLKRCIQMRCRLFGPDSTPYCEAVMHYGALLHLWKKPALAREMLQTALRHGQQALPPTAPLLCAIKTRLAVAMETEGQAREAERYHRDVLCVAQQSEPFSSSALATAYQSLAINLFQQQRWADAHTAFKACYRARLREGTPEDDPMLCTVLTWVRHIEENYLLEDDDAGQPTTGMGPALTRVLQSALAILPNPLARCHANDTH